MKDLIVTHRKCQHKRPLVTLENLSGEGWDVRPDTLRKLAAALLKAADDSESWEEWVSSERRAYPL